MINSLVLILCLFLFGCSAKQGHWSVDHLSTRSTEFNSSKITYETFDRVNGIEMEIVRANNTLRSYMIVHAEPIPPYQGNSKEAKVLISTEEKHYNFIAVRYEGGQRLLMPHPAQEAIIHALQEGKEIVIQLQGYSERINPAGFSSFFEKLNSPPRFSSHFHLPL